MRRDEQRRAGEEAIKTVHAGVETITELPTNAIESVRSGISVVTPWAAAKIVVVRSNDEAMVQYGLIFEVEPKATDNKIERVERECELPGLR